MKRICLAALLFLAGSVPTWGIYGPSLTRADAAIALEACQEAKFAQTDQVTEAMKSGDPGRILAVLDGALREWRATPATSKLYGARAFCLHELVPNRLPAGAGVGSPLALQPPEAVVRFQKLGIRYFYYDPDAEWTLDEDPVDLNDLARKHLDSRWGRQAFLMMTQLGWSQGACQEGPDEFREVIRHGEAFLKGYPQTEASDNVRLEMAHAYATWWNLSNAEADASFDPTPYKAGADAAKQKAIELYKQYLNREKTPSAKIVSRLKGLQENPKGSNQYDYFCPDYED